MPLCLIKSCTERESSIAPSIINTFDNRKTQNVIQITVIYNLHITCQYMYMPQHVKVTFLQYYVPQWLFVPIFVQTFFPRDMISLIQPQKYLVYGAFFVLIYFISFFVTEINHKGFYHVTRCRNKFTACSRTNLYSSMKNLD